MNEEILPTGTKRRLLDLLLRHERTAEDLAARLDISPTAVRQHLATLSASGLVDRRTADPTAGRPAYMYRLGELGRRVYPKRHDLLVRELIAALTAREGREATLTILADAARRVAQDAHETLGDSDPARRWESALAWLEAEFAWEADVEEMADGGRRFVLYQCPFQAVSADHPAVCGAFFTTLLEQLTGGGPYVHRVIRDGLRCCALEAGASALPEQAGPVAPVSRS
jgi:DeoR family suf operon transcriptional repressor